MTATEHGVRRIRIEGDLTIQTAAEHKQLLLTAVDEAADVLVDLAGVSEFDTAGLQVLLLARREAIRRNRILEIADPSPAVIEVLAVAHLTAALDTGTDEAAT